MAKASIRRTTRPTAAPETPPAPANENPVPDLAAGDVVVLKSARSTNRMMTIANRFLRDGIEMANLLFDHHGGQGPFGRDELPIATLKRADLIEDLPW